MFGKGVSLARYIQIFKNVLPGISVLFDFSPGIPEISRIFTLIVSDFLYTSQGNFHNITIPPILKVPEFLNEWKVLLDLDPTNFGLLLSSLSSISGTTNYHQTFSIPFKLHQMTLTLSASFVTANEHASSVAPPPYTTRLSRTRFLTTHSASCMLLLASSIICLKKNGTKTWQPEFYNVMGFKLYKFTLLGIMWSRGHLNILYGNKQNILHVVVWWALNECIYHES